MHRFLLGIGPQYLNRTETRLQRSQSLDHVFTNLHDEPLQLDVQLRMNSKDVVTCRLPHGFESRQILHRSHQYVLEMRVTSSRCVRDSLSRLHRTRTHPSFSPQFSPTPGRRCRSSRRKPPAPLVFSSRRSIPYMALLPRPSPRRRPCLGNCRKTQGHNSLYQLRQHVTTQRRFQTKRKGKDPATDSPRRLFHGAVDNK